MIIVSSLKAGAQSLQTPNVAKGKDQVWKRVGKLKHCKKPLSEKLLLYAKSSEFKHHLIMVKINLWPEYRKKKKTTEFKVVFKHWNSNQIIEFLLSLHCF